MRTIILVSIVSLFLVACGRPNRACILAENALKVDRLEGTCTSVSLGETTDSAIWRFDGGERLCRDAIGAEHPLACSVLQPTKSEIAANAKATAEREAKAKVDADAKAKIEAEAKARSEAAGAGSGSGSAKDTKKP